MAKYNTFLLHDPIGNTESQITDFNKEYLKSAAEIGMIFIGIKANGSREIVSLEEVEEPKLSVMGGLPIVLPSYVDSKISEVVDIIQQIFTTISNDIPKTIANNIQQSIIKLQNESKEVIESEKAILGSIDSTPIDLDQK